MHRHSLLNLSKNLQSSNQLSHSIITLLKISNLSLNIPKTSRPSKETKTVVTRTGKILNTSRNKAISTIKTKIVNIKATTFSNLTKEEANSTSKSITTTRIINMEITITIVIKARTLARIATRVMDPIRTLDRILITNRTTNRTSKGL